MGNLNLCASILLLCLARSSLQGGMKPQAIGRGSLYLPSLIRGAGGMQPGGGIGPAGAKAGKYPGYGSQAAPAGLGYGVPAGYGAGYRGVGYPRAGLPLGGLGARGKPSKSGYGAGRSSGGSYSGQQAYLSGVGAGSYLGNGPQNGYNNGYGPGGNGFAGAGPQPSGYGNAGAQALYGSPLGGPAGDSAAAKYGGGGQLPYSGQPRQAEAAGLGGDYGPGRYGDSSQMPYGAQPASLDAEGKPRSYGNGNGMRYVNGGDLQANGLGAAAYGPLTAGQAPGGYGSQLGYRGKESKYGMNGFLGNGYRGRCASGKC